ncbi:MAG: Na/Pi cotransporter family protein [Oscillospiraceae bacterium]|nr:Na/Pi cotransporter family protein [Oscillospiraceae bacterium]
MSYSEVISIIILMLGAIATFLFGMNTMTNGLEKLTSGRLEGLLEKLTGNIFTSTLVGALVTALIHSSAATTVMCVGFVNAGVMQLNQAVGIIMGANIGTTFTAQILRLGDISSDNIFVSLLTPEYFGPILAVVGIIFYLFVSGGKKKMFGQFCLGLGLLFIGITTMETAVSPLQELPGLSNLFTAFSNPVLGILVGAAITALLQSSTASVGLLQAMTTTGAITFNVAVPIIMGQNIGTCITTLASSVGASRNAKRTAFLHLTFNIIGTAVFMIGIYGGHAIMQAAGWDTSFWTAAMNRGGIANFHTVFNLVSTLLLLPFNKLLVRLVVRIIPGETQQAEFALLDKRFLTNPSVALEKARETVSQMGRIAQSNYIAACETLNHYDEHKVAELQRNEETLDKLEVALDDYLVHLTHRALSDGENQRVSEMLHSLSDYERIGDYAVNISEQAAFLHERGIHFSAAAQREMNTLTGAVGQVVDKTTRCYAALDGQLAQQVEPLEEVVDLICEDLRDRHVERLKEGTCTVELGTQFLDLLFNLERISDHCSNLAVRVIRRVSNVEDAHAYLQRLHAGDSEEFNRLFEEYKQQYYAPIECAK